MLRYRLVFGPLMIVAFVLLVFADQHLGALRLGGGGTGASAGEGVELPQGVVLAGVVLTLIVLVTRELAAMAAANGIPTGWGRLAVAGVLGVGSMYLLPGSTDAAAAVAPGLLIGVFATAATLAMLVATLGQGAARRCDGALSAAGVAALSFVYLGVMPGFFLLIRRSHAAWVVAAIVLLPKVCDIGAYFVGRAVGRHKLIPWLSPGKTWEGLVGGVVLSGLACAGMVALAVRCTPNPDTPPWLGRELAWLEYLPLWMAGGAGVLLGLVGQGGDLVASLLKRDSGVKDSGNTVPGFGGLLDVVDSPILVAPLAYWLLRWAAS